LALPPSSSSSSSPTHSSSESNNNTTTTTTATDVYYRYRYAIYRAGIFHRYEISSSSSEEEESYYHQVSLRVFQPGEAYSVNDTFGVAAAAAALLPSASSSSSSSTMLPTNIYHLQKARTGFMSINSLARNNSLTLRKGNSGGTLVSDTGSGTSASGGGGGVSSSNNKGKKQVGFATTPTTTQGDRFEYADSIQQRERQVVHLTSSDGLIVVSAFLPVHLTRSDIGEWSVDWDYEALLSMQTHLRVTRVGTVKWRGWHGNVGGGESSESGVPVDERYMVEAALRPFNCVPVWVPTKLFGEM
jgi:trehalose 6-phosphate synthase/phosphatase